MSDEDKLSISMFVPGDNSSILVAAHKYEVSP